MTKARKAQTANSIFINCPEQVINREEETGKTQKGEKGKRGVFTNTSKVFIWKDGNVLDGERDSLAL